MRNEFRERFTCNEAGEAGIVIQRQSTARDSRGDVLYVHGATFGADLSVFFPFDGRSWGDSIAAAGFTVWGFDFPGYGLSDPLPLSTEGPAGGMIPAVRSLRRAIAAIRARNGDRAVTLLAHSRGGAVAARYVNDHPQDVHALVLFAPVVPRPSNGTHSAASASATHSHYPLTAWAQYRRFVEDVPRGEAQVLSEEHMHAWASAFLATDALGTTCMPPSVLTPSGPRADVAAMWRGEWLYDPSRITVPTLLVRGEWDSVCDDSDARRLMSALRTSTKRDVKVARATHLMHLEERREELYAAVNRFLLENTGSP